MWLVQVMILKIIAYMNVEKSIPNGKRFFHGPTCENYVRYVFEAVPLNHLMKKQYYHIDIMT